MRPVLPVVVLVRDQTEIRLIDHRRGLQDVSGPLVPKMRAREQTQLRVNDRHQAGKRVLLAGVDLV